MAVYNSVHTGITIDNAVTWANNLLNRFAWDNTNSYIKASVDLYINSGNVLKISSLSALTDSSGNALINPDGKTSSMTQSVGIDSSGKLWTTPSSGATYSAGLGIDINSNIIKATGVEYKVNTTAQSSALKFVKLTQAQYSALSTTDANTFYIIVG